MAKVKCTCPACTAAFEVDAPEAKTEDKPTPKPKEGEAAPEPCRRKVFEGVEGLEVFEIEGGDE